VLKLLELYWRLLKIPKFLSEYYGLFNQKLSLLLNDKFDNSGIHLRGERKELDDFIQDLL
jgi:hypothetical protein